MPERLFRIVLDTNTLLRGLVSASSASARIRRAAERRLFVPLLSKPVLDEYRAVLSDEVLIRRFPEITAEIVEVTIRRLRFVSDYIRTPNVEFEYPRDAADEKFLELAIALKATHLVSLDKDLLSLSASRSDAGKRFRQRLPSTKILAPTEFIERYAGTLALD